MTDANLHELPPLIRLAFFREQMMAQGRYDAFLFALNCHGDVMQLTAEIAWYDSLLNNPSNIVQGQPYSPNTSVRLRADGYLAGLKDAVKILVQAEESQLQAVTRVAEPATNTYHVTTKKKASAMKRPPKQTRKTGRQVRRPKQQGTR